MTFGLNISTPVGSSILSDLGSFNTAGVLAAEDPHEDKLHDVRIDEEELGAAVALCSRDRIAGAAAGVWRLIREKDVLQRTELVKVSMSGFLCLGLSQSIRRVK